MPGWCITDAPAGSAGPGLCCSTYQTRGSVIGTGSHVRLCQTGDVSDVAASAALFARALAVTPGGVNSPVRAFRAVGGTPRFMASGRGAYLTDVDGNEYVDLVCSWGPMILGHAHPAVL